jgi:Rrf2 family transcriptional regulator, iron-sulfur cluster assembly transcription factor
MKLTTRSHYSVKALLDLTFQPGYGPASVNAIAQRQSIPAPYLEKLLIELRRSGLLISIRGAQGGYQLSKHPSKIRLGEILLALGESIEPLPRHQPSDREDAEDWVTFAVWNRLHQRLQVALDSISLEDLYFDARSWQAAQGSETGFVV